MEEEQSKYPFDGMVLISADEYKDLVLNKDYWYKESLSLDSQYADLKKRCLQLEKENESLNIQNEQFRKFIKDNDETSKLELWLIKMQEK